ncbi:MAG: hypothetical protein IT245_09015 [Bacteroidia bacterium]|nr:hypothetical protein [Bacteroidia bacterium]
MKRKYNLKIALGIILLSVCQIVPAQLHNRIFEQNDSFVQNDTQSIRMHIEMFNYLRNTEYFDVIEKGQTLFGTMFQAHLSYQPYKNIRLKGGLQARQDYGSSNFISVQPIFTISIFKDKWRHNFGTLQGTLNYGFIEPMYNIDRGLTNRIENGIQSIYKSDKFYFNNFLVWNEPTYRSTTNQERFTTGFVSERSLLKTQRVYCSLPFQGTLAHRGGQLNSNPNPIYTRINASLGLKLNYTSASGFRIRTENYWLASGDFSPNITQPYKNGFASWHTLSLEKNGFELMFNYWAGREWQSPVGTQIYNNYNYYSINEFRRVRHMLMSRLLFTQNINKMLMLDLRFEPFYDFEYKQIQYSYSVYLKLKLEKLIGKI